MAPVAGTLEFFIVYLPKFNEDHMRIPDKFVQHNMRGKTSGPVYLTGPSENTWTLQLVKNKDGLYFDKGWRTFVKDHMIQIGEFLVFKYDGKSGFGVVIFGYDACEKKKSFYAKCSQLAGDGDPPKVVKAEPMEASPTRTAGTPKFAEEEEPDTGTNDSAPMQQEREGQRPAKASSSKPPFFLVSMKAYNLVSGFVRIPTNFCNGNKLKYKPGDMIVVHNQKGQSKAIKVIDKRNNLVLSAGWYAFARNSGIKAGDVCMFELVGKYEMRMSTVRNDATAPPSPRPRHPHRSLHRQLQQVKDEIAD